MAYRIRELGDRLEIEIDAPAPVRETFLELLDVCTQGDQGCPALRCGSLEKTVPSCSDAPIRITLTPHPGVRVDPTLIARCLQFTLGCRRCCASGSHT